MRRATTAALAAAIWASFTPPAAADMLILKDNNIIELTQVKEEKRTTQQGTSPQVCYVGKNEQGKLEIIQKRDVVQGGWIQGKTSWELRKEHREWYEKESAKIKVDDFKAQASFARKCSEAKMSHDLDEEAEKHFRKAFELEQPTIPKDAEKAIEQFAKKIRDDYELYDEALGDRKSVV